VRYCFRKISMKSIHILFFAINFSVFQINAQVVLKGVVSVQNSKTYSGKTQFVKNAEVEHINPNKAKTKDVTGDDGKFTLNIKGVEINSQTQISVTPFGEFADYVVVNEKELKDVTLGRITPLSVYVCKKGELEQRQAEMVGINMRKLEERMEKDKKRLQNELDGLKSKNDYLNSRYREIKDSLDIISKNIDNAFERIMEYAKNMVHENLDEHDEMYIKAYHCFSKGDFDSVSYYLRDDELKMKRQKILQLQEEVHKEKELAALLTASAKQKEEHLGNSVNELIKEYLLLARTYDMMNDYMKAKEYYESLVKIDTTHVKNLLEFANYLQKIKEYANAEKYYQKALEILVELKKSNPNHYLLDDYATTLNNFASVHKALHEFPKALQEYEEALKIRRMLANENPETYIQDVAATLNNLANLHYDTKEYEKATEEFEEALKLYRKLVKETPNTYFPFLATTLNNFGNLHYSLDEYSTAFEEYEEAFKILTKLAEVNPKAYLPDVAMTLNNLATLHSSVNEFKKALEEFGEALKNYKKLAVENPKIYLPDVAMTLFNLAILNLETEQYALALDIFEEARTIYSVLADETPKAYLSYVLTILNNVTNTYDNLKDYPSAIKSIHIWNEWLLKYKEIINYETALARNYNSLSWYYLLTKEFGKAEQFARSALKLNSASLAITNLAHALLFQNRFSEAEKIYKELSQTIYRNDVTYSETLLEDLDTFEEEAVIPAERKGDVEKIRGLLKRGR